MKLDDLIVHTSEWLKGTGPNPDIVISSRIRLARNLEGISFPHRANKIQNQKILEMVRETTEEINYLKGSLFLDLESLDSLDKQFLIERHLMSREHALKKDSKALIIEKEEIVSIMVNEEDHIRCQVMQSGFDLREAWRIIDRIDSALAEKLPIAYSSTLGYLTACPTNTGTGMRASVMLHLPALVITKQINKILAAITKLSFTTRGLFGEGTEAAGNFFQISNQVSLGHTEDEIIDNISGLIKQVIEQEEQARNTLLKKDRAFLEDKIWRAFGTLKSAFIITSSETMELLSMVRLGRDLGIIKDLDRRTINELFLITQPAHLQKVEQRKLTPQERDTKRAELIRRKLKM